MIAVIFLIVMASCGQNDAKEKEIIPAVDTLKPASAATTTVPPTSTVTGPSESVTLINSLLTDKFGGTLRVVTDTDANWPKDVFDYFIAPKRKENPDYPYVAKGDFNGDRQEDAAALIKTQGKAAYQLAILFGSPLDKHRVSFWKEDIDICAISGYPKGELQGIDEPEVAMKGDGILVEFYEKAMFVVYWDGKKFKRTYTGD